MILRVFSNVNDSMLLYSIIRLDLRVYQSFSLKFDVFNCVCVHDVPCCKLERYFNLIFSLRQNWRQKMFIFLAPKTQKHKLRPCNSIESWFWVYLVYSLDTEVLHLHRNVAPLEIHGIRWVGECSLVLPMYRDTAFQNEFTFRSVLKPLSWERTPAQGCYITKQFSACSSTKTAPYYRHICLWTVIICSWTLA